MNIVIKSMKRLHGLGYYGTELNTNLGKYDIKESYGKFGELLSIEVDEIVNNNYVATNKDDAVMMWLLDRVVNTYGEGYIIVNNKIEKVGN